SAAGSGSRRRFRVPGCLRGTGSPSVVDDLHPSRIARPGHTTPCQERASILWRMSPIVDGASIDDLAADFEAEWVRLRRDIHRWPELAGDERRTAALAADRLG